MNRTEFLALAHQAPADETKLPEFLTNVLSIAGEQPAGFAGIVTALTERFSKAELWTEGVAFDCSTGATRVLETLEQGKPFNDVLLARWAVSGSLVSLAELVRRAMHRDGTTVAVDVGTDAIGLLSEAVAADPVLAAELTANNCSLESIRFGNYPQASGFSLPFVRKLKVDRSAELARLVTAAAPNPAPVAGVAPSPRPRPVPVEGEPFPDRDSGMVKLGNNQLSITAAIKLRDDLTRAVTALVRPEEGFTWTDDTMDPQARSFLFDLDPIRGKNLPDVGGLLQAEVTQVAARGPDVNAGKYTGRLYNRAGGFSEFATGADDMNAAKFAVAERVRQELKL